MRSFTQSVTYSTTFSVNNINFISFIIMAHRILLVHMRLNLIYSVSALPASWKYYPFPFALPCCQSPASWSNEQDTCNSLKTTGKKLRANLSALLRCSSQPSRSYSAQHTTFDCAKSGSACEPDLCEYLPWNYPFSHVRALVQINVLFFDILSFVFVPSDWNYGSKG